MANHKSSEKRARQSIKRTERNRRQRASVRTAVKAVEKASNEEQSKALGSAFSKLQKAKNVYHRNKIRRTMSRLAKAVSRKGSEKAA